jgi:endoglucanase
MFFKTSCFFLFLFFCVVTASAQGFLKADATHIVDESGKEIILRGIGLGGWMLQEPYMLQLGGFAGTQQEIKARLNDLIGQERTDSFYAAWLANDVRKSDVDSLAAWGFNSIRLPMHYNLFTLPVDKEPEAGKNTWLEKGFVLTDSLLQWCKSNKIYLILDLHAAPNGQGNDRAISDRDTSKPSLWQSEAAQQKTIALWRKLAERYANEPWIGGYDLINEPNWGFTNTSDKNGLAEQQNGPLKKLYMELTRTIREMDKKHMLIIEGNGWGNNYNGIFPLWDGNMVVSFHKYWNRNDTASIHRFLEVRNQYQVPIWCGESGENSNVWFTDAITLLESNHIGWAWWPLKKIGINNPFEIKAPQAYKNLIRYWKGEEPKPAPTAAFNALMQLATAAKTENTIVHKDVIDAMFRQVYDTATIPFKQHIVQPNTIVFAVDYDLGRNGFAYYDNDTADFHVSTQEKGVGNRGRVYRNDGVDIKPCIDVLTNGFNVAWMEPGEWLQYTLTVPAKNMYNINLRVKTDSAATIQLFVNGNATSTTTFSKAHVSSTGWQTVELKNIPFQPGTNHLRIYVKSGAPELNYVRFSKSTAANNNKR